MISSFNMNPSFTWVFAKGSNWLVLPESIQEELEEMFVHDCPGKIIISFFPAPLLVSDCFSYLTYIDENGTPFGYALARIVASSQLIE
jgi:hypothetical protein